MMNITLQQKEACLLELHISLSPEDFEKEQKEVIKLYRNAAVIPGFRKGKAPAEAVARKYKNEIEGETQDRLLRSSLREALKEQQLELLEYPTIDRMELAQNKELSYVATVMVRPEIEIPPYEEISVSVDKKEVTEDDVTQYLEDMRAEWKYFEIPEDRGLIMGDFAILDYTGNYDGLGLEDAELEALPTSLLGGSQVWFKMEEKEHMPGFATALLGMEPEEDRQIIITFPEDYQEECLRGKEVSYEVTLHEIKEERLPELDDAFASNINSELTMKELLKEVKQSLARQLEDQYQEEVRQAVLDHLLVTVRCDFPSTLLEREVARVTQQLATRKRSEGANALSEEEKKEEVMEIATRSLKSRLILEAIASQENLEVTPEELSQRVYMMARQYYMPVDELVKILKKNGGLAAIQTDILAIKALSHVTQHVTFGSCDCCHS